METACSNCGKRTAEIKTFCQICYTNQDVYRERKRRYEQSEKGKERRRRYLEKKKKRNFKPSSDDTKVEDESSKCSHLLEEKSEGPTLCKMCPSEEKPDTKQEIEENEPIAKRKTYVETLKMKEYADILQNLSNNLH